VTVFAVALNARHIFENHIEFCIWKINELQASAEPQGKGEAREQGSLSHSVFGNK